MPAKALAGVRGADFSWVGVGPFAAKYLADHGAEVIKIESLSHLDQTRLHPPFKDDRFELEYSANFAMWNSSKLSATLNLSNPKARELAKRLASSLAFGLLRLRVAESLELFHMAKFALYSSSKRSSLNGGWRRVWSRWDRDS